MGILWGIFSKIAGCKKGVNDLKFTEPPLPQWSSKCALGTGSFWNAIEKGLIIKSDLRFQKNVITHHLISILIEWKLKFRQQRWEISEWSYIEVIKEYKMPQNLHVLKHTD